MSHHALLGCTVDISALTLDKRCRRLRTGVYWRPPGITPQQGDRDIPSPRRRGSWRAQLLLL